MMHERAFKRSTQAQPTLHRRVCRNVYSSIIKFLQFQLTINVVAVATAVAGVAVLSESPLNAVQLLWVNLIMDSLASLSLATEAPTDGMLAMQPFSSTTPLLTPTCVKHICGQVRRSSHCV